MEDGSKDAAASSSSSPTHKTSRHPRSSHANPDREIDCQQLADMLRKSADIVERGEFASVLYEALQDFRVYYKQKYPKTGKKKKSSSSRKHGSSRETSEGSKVSTTTSKTQSLGRENSVGSVASESSTIEATKPQSSLEILDDLKESEQEDTKSDDAAAKESGDGAVAKEEQDDAAEEETSGKPTVAAEEISQQAKTDETKPSSFTTTATAEEVDEKPKSSARSIGSEEVEATTPPSIPVAVPIITADVSVAPPPVSAPPPRAVPVVPKQQAIPFAMEKAIPVAPPVEEPHRPKGGGFKKFKLGATLQNVKKAAKNVTQNVTENIKHHGQAKAAHQWHQQTREDLEIFQESGIKMAESSGRRTVADAAPPAYNPAYKSRGTGGPAGASTGETTEEPKPSTTTSHSNVGNVNSQYLNEIIHSASATASEEHRGSAAGLGNNNKASLFETKRFTSRLAKNQVESFPEEDESSNHDSEGLAPDPIMEGGLLGPRPGFQRPANRDSTLVANGWIEQFRRSKMRHVWKEVLASLVEGRKPGEVTTLWIQREMSNPTTGQKELEPLHRIPMKAVENISFTEYSTDNQFRIKLYNSTEDFVFRCPEAPNDALRWVQILKQHEQLSMQQESSFEEKKASMADNMAFAQPPSSTKGLPIRDLRAICHGAGINTSGMERTQLEAAAEEVQKKGTYFEPKGEPQPSVFSPYGAAVSSSAQEPTVQAPTQEQQQPRLGIKELRAICHGAGISTAGMERGELEAAAKQVQDRGTFFAPAAAPAMPHAAPPSEDDLRARQEADYRRQQQQQQQAEELRRRQEAEAALKRQQAEELRKRQESEAALKRHQQEVEENRRRAAELEKRKQEEARRRALEEEARRRAIEEEVRRRAAEEARHRAAAEEHARRQREAQERYAQQQAAWQQQQQQEEQRRRMADDERRRREEALRQQQQWATPTPGATRPPVQPWQQQQQQAYPQQQYQQQQPWQQQQQQQRPPQQQPRAQTPPPPPQQHAQRQHSGADNKYAKMANQSGDDGGQAAITKLKHGILIQWALQPPQLQMLRPIAALVTTIHTVFPPSLGVPGHDYFSKWKAITRADISGTNGLPEEAKLKKAVRKIRFFLHPDKLPHDLNEEQKFMVKMLWDVTNDSWEEHQKHKEELDWVN